MNKLDKLMERMIEFDGGDPKRIQHFIKVHSFAQQIGVGEGLDVHTQELHNNVVYCLSAIGKGIKVARISNNEIILHYIISINNLAI